MFRRIWFIFFYLVGWVLFFQTARLFFIAYQYSYSRQLSFKTLVLTFRYGLRMDLSMAAYITLPVCLFTLLSIVLLSFRAALLYKIYTVALVLIIGLLIVIDCEVFRAWGFRLDATPLKYLNSPNEVWASVSHLPLFRMLFFILIVCTLTVWLINKLLSKLIVLQHNQKAKLLQAFFVLIVTGLMIIPLRGGLQLAPINQSTVYFSSNHFANLTALNASWNFFHSLLKRKNTAKNPYGYMAEAKAEAIVDSLYKGKGSFLQVVDTTVKPNIILIIWESFTKKATEMVVNGKEVTPFFNLLKKEGIYFNNAYASGDRTDKGLTAILSGYPALPKLSIIRDPVKTAKLTSLSKSLAAGSYYTSFYYGGETEFANIKSYLLEQHFDKIISKNDFAKKDQNSKWGAHDGVVMQRLLNDLNAFSSPFFTTWLTLSSHEPFETPVAPVFNGSDITSQFLNAHHYTDSCIYSFVQQCKQKPWWDHTLLIIVADHGHPQPTTDDRRDEFKIPILWLGGALAKTNYIVEKEVSQVDIAGTLIRQLGHDHHPFSFSKNSFDSTIQPWAFFTFNDGFGWVQPDKSFLFDNVGKRIIQQKGTISAKEVEAGKAMQQFTYDDFLKK